MAKNEWILDVLSDLNAFAVENGLKAQSTKRNKPLTALISASPKVGEDGR